MSSNNLSDCETALRTNIKPFWYCTFITKHPWVAFGLTLTGHLSLTLLNFLLMACGYNIFPVNFQVFPVQMTDHIVAQREYAWRYRDVEQDHINRIVVDNLGPTWDRGYTIDTVKIYFTDGGRNLFTQRTLQVIQATEENAFNITEYQSTFCQLDAERECIKPVSLIRYFDGTYKHVSNVFYDPHFDNITNVIYEAYTNPVTAYDFRYFIGKGYSITKDHVFVDLTRTSISLGWPLGGNGTTSEKNEIVDDFLIEQIKPSLEYSKEAYQDLIEISYVSLRLFQIEIIPQVIKDVFLAVGSLIFIFSFISFVTKSLWISGWAILSIITCFFITNLIYRIVLDYIYIGFLHVIAIFIILGIGADDIFVYYNCWRKTGMYTYPSIAHRMSDAYRRSAGTMFFTSFTTMMAFISGGISPILPLGSFGIFSGILIGVNYISVIVFFPNVVYTHYIYFNKKSRTGVDPDSVHNVSYNSNIGAQTEKEENYINSIDMSTSKTSYPISSTLCEKAVPQNEVSHTDHKELDKLPDKLILQKPDVLTVFFSGKYFKFITKKTCRWLIMLGFTALISLMCWSATNIEVDSEEIKFYKENTNYGRAMRHGGSGFITSGDNYVVLYIVWGMWPRDYSMCHKTDYECGGKQVWDEAFDMNTPSAQLSLKDFCSKLKYGLSTEELKLLMIQNNSVTGELAVDCFMDNLNEYMINEEKRLNSSYHLDFPLKEGNMKEYMNKQPNIYEENLDKTFYRYFEVGLSNWINNHYLMVSTLDYITFDALLGENMDGNHTKPVLFHDNLFNQTLAYYGSKLRYATIRVNLSLSTQELSYQVGLPIMDNWEKFIKEQVSKMPISLQSAFQATDITWHWLTIQQTLVYNAVLGIVMGISITLPILILATQNIIVGLLGTVNIICITVCVLGVIPLAGWKLDVMISMNLCLLVGLSIDYVMHIAEGYHLSHHKTRKLRVQDTLENLGVSVLSGAFTTLGAAFLMMFAKIQFFLQFGTFLLSTIGFALLFSMVLLPTLLSAFGPEGDTGSIIPPFRWIWYKVIGRSNNDNACPNCQGKGFVQRESKNEKKDNISDEIRFDDLDDNTEEHGENNLVEYMETSHL